MTYRQGVYIVLVNEGRFLVAHSTTHPTGEWYFPGGGIDEGESSLDAFYREAHEELGLQQHDFETVKVTNTTLQYSWPEHLRQEHGYEGQIKRFVIGHLTASSSMILPTQGELDGVMWVDEEQVHDIVPFDNLKQAFRELSEEL